MRRGLLAEFDSIASMRAAVDRLCDEGYRDIDAYMPYPDERVLERLGRRPTSVTLIGGIFAVLGVATGYGLQWLLNAWIYPLDVGGRPPHSVPAFVPITFETGVLFCALATFVATLGLSGLPRLWRPEFEIDGFDRASVDRFWVYVCEADPRFDPEHVRDLLASSAALRVITVPAGEVGR